MFTSTATAPAAVQKTRRGLGDQPRLLAHSIMARPRQHSPTDAYMMRFATMSGKCGAPAFLASDVSGSSTGGVATLGWGAVAHSPTNATPPRPSALSVTAGSGRASRLWARTRMSRPISASTRPPGMGGSASLGAGDAGGAVGETVATARPPGWADPSSALSRGGGSTITAIHFLLARDAR